MIGPSRRACFGGDTGYAKSFAQVGVDHGPFDLTLMPIGAYHPAWVDILLT
ncbi:MBL fold metallo-hydrolase [Mycobacterium leprae]|uniref:MBL fold metallo-hydrolase n=1 Tax=Mycobacterium leprae TaxID=1769 RepID=UPI0002FC9F75|nr:MBL fold metallo-hydrolase [Mycobacterium leprae]